MFAYLKQSTATQTKIVGPFIDDTDFKTPETGLTIANTDVKLSANGGTSFNKTSGGGTHIANSMYALTFDATDSATVGELNGSIKMSGALVVTFKFWILEEAVYDDMFGASAPGYLKPTTATRTLDVTAGGTAGIDWANVESPTTANDLSGTDIQLCDTTTTNTDMVGTDSALLASSAPTNFGAMGIESDGDITKVNLVAVTTLTDTTTTNTDMRGTDSANTVVPMTAALSQTEHNATQSTLAGLNDVAATDIVSAGAITTLTGAVVNVDLVDTTTTNTDMVGTNNAALASALATHDGKLDTVETNVDSILLDTDTTIPALIAALNDLSASQINAEVLDVMNVDTFVEPAQGTPASTQSIVYKLGLIYKHFSNKSTQSATEMNLFNSAGTTVDQQATVSESASIITKGTMVTGP